MSENQYAPSVYLEIQDLLEKIQKVYSVSYEKDDQYIALIPESKKLKEGFYQILLSSLHRDLEDLTLEDLKQLRVDGKFSPKPTLKELKVIYEYLKDTTPNKDTRNYLAPKGWIYVNVFKLKDPHTYQCLCDLKLISPIPPLSHLIGDSRIHSSVFGFLYDGELGISPLSYVESISTNTIKIIWSLIAFQMTIIRLNTQEVKNYMTVAVKRPVENQPNDRYTEKVKNLIEKVDLIFNGEKQAKRRKFVWMLITAYNNNSGVPYEEYQQVYENPTNVYSDINAQLKQFGFAVKRREESRGSLRYIYSLTPV